VADFTIVTPVLNQASSIEACIQSVASQKVDVEHIIIDGGSTDGTLELIMKHESTLAYWVSENDNGQSEAINKGLKLATGTFFNWLNADDVLNEGALEKVLNCTTNAADIVVGKCQHVNADGELLDLGQARIWDSLEATLGNYSMGQPSVFYRTDVIKELGGLNENLHLCMDMDLWFRYLISYGQKNIDTIEEILSSFLVRTDSKSSLQVDEMKAEKHGLYHALLSRFPLAEALKQFFKEYLIPYSVQYEPKIALDGKILTSNFAWHLMIEAYNQSDLKDCKALFEVVKVGNRLTESEKLMWKARLLSGEILKK